MATYHFAVRQIHRWLMLCFVAILLLSSSVSNIVAAQSTPSTTPATDSDSQLYVGHGAQLTAEMPSHWQPDMSLDYDYAFPDNFISSVAVSDRSLLYTSLHAVCDFVAALDQFDKDGEIESTTWRGMRACLIRSATKQTDDPISLVFAHPDPADDGHNAWVVFTVDAAHFEEITATNSFDPSRITPAAYLDSAIDFIETHSLWRDAIDWPEVRAEAHSYLDELVELGLEPDTLELETTYPAIQYVVDQLYAAGADGHNVFLTSAPPPVDRPYTSPGAAKLPDGVGYVSVPGLRGNEQAVPFALEIRDRIESQRNQTTCGWIVDLRGDTGGNMYPMVVGLAPLLQPGELIRFRDADGNEINITSIEWQPI